MGPLLRDHAIWLPAKDMRGSTPAKQTAGKLRFEGLRCARWVPDNDIPGSALRFEGLRCATRFWYNVVMQEYYVYILVVRRRRIDNTSAC